jgi:primosomal protein N' (replication factor Y) (superfamily II helicase)
LNRTLFCKVAFCLPIKKLFTYALPANLHLEPGQRVEAPFGPRKLTGVVTEISEVSEFKELKTITRVIDEIPLLTPALLEFTRWISEYYLCSWGEVLPLAFPPSGNLKKEFKIKLGNQETLKKVIKELKPVQIKSATCLELIIKKNQIDRSFLIKAGLSLTVLKKALELKALIQEEDSFLDELNVTEPPQAWPELYPRQKQAVEEITACFFFWKNRSLS